MMSYVYLAILLTMPILLTRASIVVGIIAGITTALIGMFALGSKINKAMRRQDKIDKAVLSMDDALKDIAGMQSTISQMGEKLIAHMAESEALLNRELKANGGTSIKDRVTDATRALEDVARDVAHVQATLNGHIDDAERHVAAHVRAHSEDPGAHR